MECEDKVGHSTLNADYQNLCVVFISRAPKFGIWYQGFNY